MLIISTENAVMLPAHMEEESEDQEAPPPGEEPAIATGRRVAFKPPPSTAPASQSLAHRGRPIAQVTHIPDPVRTF